MRTAPIQSEIHEDNPEAPKHEHEPRREPLDDVLSVNPTRQKHHRLDGVSYWILNAADARWLHDHVVDDAGDDGEVGEEDEGEHSHRRGEGDCGGDLQADARRPEEGEGEDAEEVEERIQGAGLRRRGHAGGGGGVLIGSMAHRSGLHGEAMTGKWNGCGCSPVQVMLNNVLGLWFGGL